MTGSTATRSTEMTHRVSLLLAMSLTCAGDKDGETGTPLGELARIDEALR